MEIPRQKKTVRVAVTRPSVKKGAIVVLIKTRLTEARLRGRGRTLTPRKFRASLVVASSKNKNPLAHPFFASPYIGEGPWSVFSFEFLAPERSCVLVSAQVPVNPCK
jgi:hypothetical protein